MKKALSILEYVLLGGSVLSVATMFFMSEGDAVSLMLIWAYILIGLAIAVVILLPAFSLAQNPQGAVRSLMGLGVVAVVAVICYALADATPLADSAGKVFDNPLELKLSDMGLYATYFALVAAIVVTVVGEIWSSVK